MSGRVWVVDDAPNERFPLWTRGNVGEVFPEVVMPLTWSLLGGEVELAWRDAMARFGAVRARDIRGVHPACIGVFGGYCYLNASVSRLLALRTPGMTIEQMDQAILGVSGAPPHRPSRGDRSRLATLRATRTVATSLLARRLPHLDDDRAALQDWQALQPHPQSASDAVLRRTIDQLGERFRHLMADHMHTTYVSTVPVSVLTRMCAEVGDPTLLVRLLGGLGAIESAAPSHALWQLGREVVADPELTALFDDGLTGLEGRLAATRTGARFLAGLADFQQRHGARGPNEWEGSALVWGTDVRLVLAAIDGLRRAGADHDPVVVLARQVAAREEATAEVLRRLPRRSRPLFRRAMRATAVYSRGREMAKTTIVSAVHTFRLAVLELGRRTAERGGPADPASLWLLTIDELDAYLANPLAFADVQAERSAQRDGLKSLVPPFVFEGSQPDPSTWTKRVDVTAPRAVAGDLLRGIAGCAGLARGRARIVLDPSAPGGIGPGDVLVAPISDPSWTPLFMAVDAVVVEVGAQMSHAVIVSRELGIPCVVSVTGATAAIDEGTELEVDGAAGTVTVLSAR